MSSNGFLTTIELLSCPRLCVVAGRVTLRRQQLQICSDGRFLLLKEHAAAPMVLLQHKSVWTTSFAAISLQTDIKQSLRLLFLRSEQGSDAWRRARVRLNIPI
jgi:hypothetical protein